MKKKILVEKDGKLTEDFGAGVRAVVDADDVTITNAVSGYIKISIKALQEIAEEVKKGV